MKKEKTIRTYQRRTKSGKVVTVRQHTASYDAAEKLREMAKKKGAGKEFEDRKSKGMPDPSLPLEQYLDELSKRKKESEAEDSVDVSREDAKTQEKGAKRLSNKVTSLEKKLHDLKYTYSGLKRSDPKRLGYARRIQKLQEDLIATKKASAHQDSTASSVKGEDKKGSEKKTAEKVRPVGSGTKVDKQTKAWFNSSPSSFSKVKVSKDKFGWRIDLSDGSGQVYDSKEAAQKDAKLLRGMYKEWKGSSKGPKGSTPTKTSTSSSASSPAFTAAEFKEWYRGTGSAADKKVAKALREQLGRAGYRKLEDEAIDGYSARGHLSMFKRVSGGSGVNESKKGAAISKTSSTEKSTSAKAEKTNGYTIVKGPGMMGDDFAVKGGKAYTRDVTKKNPKWKLMKEGPVQRTVLEYYEALQDTSKPSSKLKRKTSTKTAETKESSSKRKGPMVASGPDDFKSFLKSPKPEKGSKGYAVHMALRSVARAGIGTDDSIRDALVRNGYPKDKAYSKGVKEVVALAKKHGLRL